MRAGKPVEKEMEKKKKLDYIIEEDLDENKSISIFTKPKASVINKFSK